MIAVVDNYILMAGNPDVRGSLLFRSMLESAATFAEERGLTVKVAHHPRITNQREFDAFVEEFKNL